MKLIVLGDCHIGVRNDNENFHSMMERFFTLQLFPYMRERGIKEILQLGDLWDRRKFISFKSLHRSRGYLFDRLRDDGFHMTTLLGNHDVTYKNTNEVNASSMLLEGYQDCVTVVTEPTTIDYDGLEVCVLPWICPENRERVLRFMEQTNAQVLAGHLEVSGFEMYRGYVMEHGEEPVTFSKFDVVVSGHFHHKSSYGNIHYVGAPYEMTWADWNDPRGFHVFDTETRELEFHRCRFPMFHKLYYDDHNKTMEQLLDFDPQTLEHGIVKVVVTNKDNPYWLDSFVSKVQFGRPIEVHTVEDHLHLDALDDEDFIEDVEDTITILNKYAEQFKDRVPLPKLKKFLGELYHDALRVE